MSYKAKKDITEIVGKLIPDSDFTIIKITKIALKVNRSYFVNKKDVVSQIQGWYKNLPYIAKDRSEKKIVIGTKVYSVRPNHGMQDYYAHFDPEKKTGCLLTVKFEGSIR